MVLARWRSLSDQLESEMKITVGNPFLEMFTLTKNVDNSSSDIHGSIYLWPNVRKGLNLTDRISDRQISKTINFNFIKFF